MIVGLKKYPLLNPAPGAAGGGLNLEPDPDDVNDLPPDDDAGGQPDPDNMTAEEKAIARGDIIPAPPPAPAAPTATPPAAPSPGTTPVPAATPAATPAAPGQSQHVPIARLNEVIKQRGLAGDLRGRRQGRPDHGGRRPTQALGHVARRDVRRHAGVADGLGIDAVGSPTPTSRFRSFATRWRFLLQEVYFFHRDRLPH